MGIPSIKEVLVIFFNPHQFFLSKASCASQMLEEVGNHSCGMHFRPEGSAPQALYLQPQTIGDFFYMVVIKDAPQQS